MSNVLLKGIRKSFGSVEALKGIDLDVPDGKFVVFVGPSGCGKTTLMRIVAGLESQSAGDVMIDGKVVNELSPSDRGVAMVFQSYALYPHLSVRQNLRFPLRMGNVAATEAEARVAAVAETLQITTLLDRRPSQLSGGQKQRVAIGRTIVRDRKLFLFDEPLSNLDADLRVEMRLEIQKLHRRLGATMIYVTHDQVEAMTLADIIVIMRDGQIEQIGSPIDLYDRPATKFVASFLGSPKINLLTAEVTKVESAAFEAKMASGETARIGLPITAQVGAMITIAVRPEDLSPTEGDVSFPITVDILENLGSTMLAHGTSGAERLTVEYRRSGGAAGKIGHHVRVQSGSLKIFGPDGNDIVLR